MFSDSLNRKPAGAAKPAETPNRTPAVSAKPDIDKQATEQPAGEKPTSTDAGLYSFPSNEREQGSFRLDSNQQGGEGGVNFSGYLDAGMGRGYNKGKWINGNTH